MEKSGKPPAPSPKCALSVPYSGWTQEVLGNGQPILEKLKQEESSDLSCEWGQVLQEVGGKKDGGWKRVVAAVAYCVSKFIMDSFALPFQVKWYLATMLLDPNENRLMEKFGIRHSLVIHKARKSDFGNYSCSAENKLGRSRAFIEVSGKFKKQILCEFFRSLNKVVRTLHLESWRPNS